MDKQNVVYSYMQYYSGTKMNEVLIYGTTGMNSENIMLSEKRLSEKWHIIYDCIYMKYPK